MEITTSRRVAMILMEIIRGLVMKITDIMEITDVVEIRGIIEIISRLIRTQLWF